MTEPPAGSTAAATLEIGLVLLPEDVSTIVRYAQAAESAGVRRLGICDSPYVYADPHATIQAALGGTSSLAVGTLVTNPVTRHWSVQAAAVRTLDELAPGRVFMGIGTGDTAVLDVGLAPARLAELEAYVERYRERAPGSAPVVVAAGGPKSVGRAARYADELVIAQGMAPGALEALGRIADDARPDSGPPAPKWMLVIMSLVDSEDETVLAIDELRETVVGQAKQAFGGTLEAKGLDDEERARVERYMAAEASGDGKPLSARERGEAERVFFDRFGLVGTPEAVAERFRRAVDETGYTRAFIAVVSADADRVIRLAVERLLPRLLG